jgi:cell wall-associated NlpC family hydrolase
VALARAWIGTPYVLGAHVRGAGVDCATLIAEYLIECGFAQREDLGIYSHDWFCHTSEERYVRGLLRHSVQTIEGICRGAVEAAPGDIALFRVVRSRVYNHGAIVTEWPLGVHAFGERVSEVDLTKHRITGFQEMAIFDPWHSPRG